MRIKRLDVPLELQSTSPVCWLACATMIMQYKRHRSISEREVGYSRGNFRMQSVATVSGWPEFRAQLASRGFRQLRVTDNQTPDTAAIVLLYLQRNQPLMFNHHCGVMWYGPGRHVPKTGSHAVVLTGIDTNRSIVYFNNPWGDKDVPTSIESVHNGIQRWEAALPSNGALLYLA